jgi:AbrB family looped-hinge helix DNA binding protein
MTTGVMTVSSKGQVTIPARLRKMLGLTSDRKVRYKVEGDSIKIERAKSIEENAEYFTSLIQPGTKPITDAHKFVEDNWDGRF